MSTTLRTFTGHSGYVLSCAFSIDGRLFVSASADKTLKIWDVQTGQCKCTLSGHSFWVRACCFSPDGANVLSGSADKTLKIWDAATGARLGGALSLHFIS